MRSPFPGAPWAPDRAALESTIVEAVVWHGHNIDHLDIGVFSDPMARKVLAVVNNYKHTDAESRLRRVRGAGLDHRLMFGLWHPQDVPIRYAAQAALDVLGDLRSAELARAQIVAALGVVERDRDGAARRLRIAAELLAVAS